MYEDLKINKIEKSMKNSDIYLQRFKEYKDIEILNQVDKDYYEYPLSWERRVFEKQFDPAITKLLLKLDLRRVALDKKASSSSISTPYSALTIILSIVIIFIFIAIFIFFILALYVAVYTYFKEQQILDGITLSVISILYIYTIGVLFFIVYPNLFLVDRKFIDAYIIVKSIEDGYIDAKGLEDLNTPDKITDRLRDLWSYSWTKEFYETPKFPSGFHGFIKKQKFKIALYSPLGKMYITKYNKKHGTAYGVIYTRGLAADSPQNCTSPDTSQNSSH
ncbi:MAG: hypothetical protein Q4P78_08180 [Rothia sp. (in: high G+C Gram-positive bacteria)]|uniref:hypothetical protein n=1 Tax=Rothia sp. (in: high G+C Gram-positive bacteria) TaxID=1885016 RepID=UPI0026DF5F8C|nr:hypothetical protein [Rothia sp. (in: high G+C Gram-positive bacteria)]MDO5751153.1 hypothetical protein [Rothia sp. (in: high G+C Gram-positive bacteria)]